MPPPPTVTNRTQTIWRSRVGSALRTAVACSIVGCTAFFGPRSLQHLLAFPTLSYLTVVLIVSEATLGDALRGFCYAICGTIQGVIPAFLSLWVIGPAKYSVCTIVVAVTLSAFVVALPDSTHVISKRIALAQIVMAYVVASVPGVNTGVIMHPVHVGASMIFGAAASVVALVIPYPRFSCHEVRDKCKLFKENALQRLNHYVNALCTDDISSVVASLSQAKALVKTGSTILRDIKLKQVSSQWERPQLKWSLIDRLQAFEVPLRGMEIALTSSASFPVRVVDQDRRDFLLSLKENIVLNLQQSHFSLSKDSSTSTESNEEAFDNSLSVACLTLAELPSMFFLFCMKLIHNQLINKESVENTAIHQLAPTLEEPKNSPKKENFTIKTFLRGWHVNISTGKLLLALKCSLSLGLAVLFGMMFSRENGYWSGLTVAFGMEFGREATIRNANLKAQGTVLGAMYGVLSCFVFQRFLEIRFLSLLPWIIFTSFLRHSKMYHAGANSAILTALIILGRKDYGLPGQFAMLRITEAFIGLMCSIVVELLIQPTRASTLAKRKLTESFKTLHECVESICIHVNHGNKISECLSEPEKRKELKITVTQLGKFIEEAEAEPNFWFLPFHGVCYGKLLGSLSKLVDLLYFINNAMEFLAIELHGFEDALKMLHNSINGDLALLKKTVGSSVKCLEEVASIKSLASLNKEIDARGITYDLELGESPNIINRFKITTADGDEMETTVNSFVEHSRDFIAKCYEIQGDEEVKGRIVLFLSALGFCISELMTETRELETSVKELLQWENPSSSINLYEIHCKMKALCT